MSIDTLDSLFAKAKSENRAVLLGYIPAGFPDKESCLKMIEAMAAGGVDAVEIGFPYSDPVMDGPVIQAAAFQALQNKTTMQDLFDIATAAKEFGIVPLNMTYWNPIEKYGVKNFVNEATTSGISAVITPDLTIEESATWLAETQQQGLGRVYVLAPSSSDERIELVAKLCRGFIYAASLMGVTGVRTELSAAAKNLVQKIRKVSHEPICVGLGVSTGEQVKEISAFADGVIVGSAFIKEILNSESSNVAFDRVKALAIELKTGVYR
jgi:tryptophan synthase alpha chain